MVDPLKLTALLSGASILFLSLRKRTKLASGISFAFYLFLSLFIGFISSPLGKPSIFGIPAGIGMFILLHLWALLFIVCFDKALPKRRQPFFLPLFFGGVLFLLSHFPSLAWLEKWIDGLDLLLLILGVYSFIEDEGLTCKGPYCCCYRKVTRPVGGRKERKRLPRNKKGGQVGSRTRWSKEGGGPYSGTEPYDARVSRTVPLRRV